MKELKEPCKSAIKEERCLGCNKLEDPDFTRDKECIWLKNINRFAKNSD